ncbi:MAG: UDP-N-acetylmuramate dehydrogenase [Haliangium ochraceum]
MAAPFAIADDVALAGLTTLELGGPARHVVVAADETTVAAAVAWTADRGLPLLILGGGSNVVAGDAGFDGVVLRMALRGLRFQPAGDRVLVHAAAGEPWDDLVGQAVARGLAGVECLAGIPGLVGATPIQNVGAYGQEVAETIHAVRAHERATGQVVELPPGACGFGYRDSRFKRQPDAYVVLGVTFALSPGVVPPVRYAELAAAIAGRAGGRPLTLADISATVRMLRRKKSMVIDAADPNRRSVGSFFTNPLVSPAVADAAAARAVAAGVARATAEMPRFPGAEGAVKLSAGWLIEHAGFAKGWRRGPVGLSTNHALALVHHGGGSARDLIALARDIRDAVARRFGVILIPEPVLSGGSWERELGDAGEIAGG